MDWKKYNPELDRLRMNINEWMQLYYNVPLPDPEKQEPVYSKKGRLIKWKRKSRQGMDK